MCVFVCEHVCVSLLDTCGAIMTALAHRCLRIAQGYRSVLVRHAAGQIYEEDGVGIQAHPFVCAVVW